MLQWELLMSHIEKWHVTDRAAWLERRQKDVTASAIGALVGCHEWLTAYGLWAHKTGRIKSDQEEPPPIRRGRLLEPVALQIIREEYPQFNAYQCEHYYRDAAGRIGATPDIIANCPERGLGVIQVKSVQQSVFKQKWCIEDGMYEPPVWIALQAMLEAHMTGAKWAAVAPMVVGHGIEMPLIDIPIIDGVVERMRQEVKFFWDLVDSGREPAPDWGRDMAVIDGIFSKEWGVEIDLTRDNEIPELLSRRSILKLSLNMNENEIAEIDAQIKHKMGDAAIAYIQGGRKITWKMQKRQAFSVAATQFRVLRVPKTKD
jgi:hypothetical protein